MTEDLEKGIMKEGGRKKEREGGKGGKVGRKAERRKGKRERR